MLLVMFLLLLFLLLLLFMLLLLLLLLLLFLLFSLVKIGSGIAEILMTLSFCGGGGGGLKSFSCQTQLLRRV